MEFVETPIFTKIIQPLLTDEDYQKLQQELANKPEAGNLFGEVEVCVNIVGLLLVQANEEASALYISGTLQGILF